MPLLTRYRALVTAKTLKPDAEQQAAATALDQLARALKHYRPAAWWRFGRGAQAPRGLYIWGDVGRGKSMLMDLFFEAAQVPKKTRVHFNAFMVQTHARIHAARQAGESDDPIVPVAKLIARDAQLLCFDEFQVSDVADAMILGRLFEQLFVLGVVIVATSNTPPERLYEGGLNRQLFLPFIAQIQHQLSTVTLNGPTDYRQHRLAGMKVYLTPLGNETKAVMDADFRKVTDGTEASPVTLRVLGRDLAVPLAAAGVARFGFDDVARKPLAAADFLAIAQSFHTVLIDDVPVMGPDMRNEARRFMLLIDTLYDEGVKLICSAEAEAEALYPQGDGAQAFRRTASRLVEMQSADYLARGHRIEMPPLDID
ncbi:MAG TPA: cell division protein ZapE [Rhizomicrobium sp.]|nr:cell division protein ZapE [Rhizomicrobium sp.]